MSDFEEMGEQVMEGLLGGSIDQALSVGIDMNPEKAQELLDANYDASLDFINKRGEINKEALFAHVNIFGKMKLITSLMFHNMFGIAASSMLQAESRERPSGGYGLDELLTMKVVSEVGSSRNGILNQKFIADVIKAVKDNDEELSDKPNILLALVGTTVVMQKNADALGYINENLFFTGLQPIFAAFKPAVNLEYVSSNQGNIEKPDGNTIQIVRSPSGNDLPVDGASLDMQSLNGFSKLYVRGEVLWTTNLAVLAACIVMNDNTGRGADVVVDSAMKSAGISKATTSNYETLAGQLKSLVPATPSAGMV